MNSDLPLSDIRSLWQSQTSELPRLSAEEIRREANRFQRTIRWRNAREYVAALFVVGASGWFAWTAETMMSRVGHGLVIAGTLYVVHRLWTAGAARPLPVDAVATSCVAFHRQAIARQRDLLRSVWRWYLGPLLPGVIVLFAERAVDAATQGPGRQLRVALSMAICILVFFGIGWLNRRAARALDEEIRALGAFEE